MPPNGMRPLRIQQQVRKPVRGEEVATKDGKTFVVLATGMKYVDVWDVSPVPSRSKHLIKISDITITGNIINVD